MDKAALRKHFIPLRKGAPVGDAAQVAARLQAILPNKDFVLASYLPIRGEWDPWPIIAHLGPVQTALPITPTEPGALTFRRWQWGEPCEEGPFKTRQPTQQAPLVALNCLVFLVPGVAADRQGVRLGYGGGYYDRTFAALGDKLARRNVIGMMFDCQLSAHDLPYEPTDIRLGHLITPTQTLSYL